MSKEKFEYNEDNYVVSEDRLVVDECYIATFEDGLESNIVVTEIYRNDNDEKIIKGIDTKDQIVEINCTNVVRWIW